MINFDLNTTEKNIVGSVNEMNGNLVGQKYVNEDGEERGEIFNAYDFNTAKGSYSHAEGYNCTAGGDYSHAEGWGSDAVAVCAHAEGQSTMVDGKNSHAEGHATQARGSACHAEGENCNAFADYSHAEGIYNQANSEAQHVEGKYSYSMRDAIHIVGIGTSTSKQKNAHVILSDDGAHYIINIGNYAGKGISTSTKSLQQVITELEAIHTPVITEGDPVLWCSQTEGIVDGSLQQVQYDAIKERIDKGLPIIIRVNFAEGYTATFTAVTSSSGTTEGQYSFSYIDYNTTTNQYFLKLFKMESDLTCQVYTKVIWKITH